MNAKENKMADSKHLNEIMVKHHHVANLQVVFVDIEKYSKRRTKTQTEVIDKFTLSLKEALIKTSKEFVGYAENNNINFKEDIITIPTGDGAAIVFSFSGLSEIHLFFAKSLLEETQKLNEATLCDKYNDQSWCNCHGNFGVRIGISEDTGIVYKDINENYNVAGNVINLASRVMAFGNKNQIIFTEVAYRQIIDMVDDPNLVDIFVEFQKVKMKHGVEENIYQYIGKGEPYIDSNPPESLGYIQRLDKVMSTMTKGLGMQLPDFDNKEETIKRMEAWSELMSGLLSTVTEAREPKQIIDIKKKEKD